MRITLITPEIHAELLGLLNDHPELRFQNNGYEYLSREVQEAKAEQIARISAILKDHVEGFVKFFNFNVGKDGAIRLRFDYVWDPHTGFVGVGYLNVDRLRDGFPVGASQA